MTMGSGMTVTRGSGHVMTKPVDEVAWAADHDYGGARTQVNGVTRAPRMFDNTLLDTVLEVSEDELEDSFISRRRFSS